MNKPKPATQPATQPSPPDPAAPFPEKEMPVEYYTVHSHTADYPDRFVIKRWQLTGSGPAIQDNRFFFASTERPTCREMLLTMGKMCIGGISTEDPTILEQWA